MTEQNPRKSRKRRIFARDEAGTKGAKGRKAQKAETKGEKEK
jgi:hypothetical protein